MHALLALSCLPLLSNALASKPSKELYSPLIYRKVLDTFRALPIPAKYPQYTDKIVGDWLYFAPDTWTSGFFPATAYALNTRKAHCRSAYDLQNIDWLSLGRAASNDLIPLEATNNVGHDVGFLSFPFVDELVLNPLNQTAQNAVNAFARDLAARFNPIVGCTRSWDSPDPVFEVIIDNMMNLEVLFRSAALTGIDALREIAIRHADTTMVNHIRSDGSTWHVVEYNTFTGAVIKKVTAQGYSDNSTWSRGQAWAIYGFANMYRNTNNIIYLETARKAARYFLKNIPADGIVPWDFNAPAPRPADSSAATIAATGLLMIARLETTPLASERWTNAAIQILNHMTSLAWQPSWQSILANGTVNKPAKNYMTGTVYGDYYFIKAGNELLSMGLAKC